MHWFSMPAAALLKDTRPNRPVQRIRFGTLDDGFDAVVAQGRVEVTPPAPSAVPDAVVSGPGKALVGLVQGFFPIEAAASLGVVVEGDADALRRVLPGNA